MQYFKSGVLFIMAFFLITQCKAQALSNLYDFINFERYEGDNLNDEPKTVEENRVVFMGNSITEGWVLIRPDFFKNSNFIGRGISGQTTPQMLMRFRKDVINLKPKVVVILAGINDIAQNTGYMPIEMIAENIMSMSEIARYNNIQVIICSVIPAIDFPWKPKLKPAEKVIQLNRLLEDYARENDLLYVDYHSAMKDEDNGLRVPELTSAEDLVHPNAAGYAIMEELLQPAIAKALSRLELTVNPFFTNHIVLQQKEEVAVWGKAPSGQEVKVNGSWGAESITTADENNSWKLDLKTPQAGGPHKLIISASNKQIEINDVMIGEVWLASGQSNMSMPLKGWLPEGPILNSEMEISAANYPEIRMFKVANNFSVDEESSFEGYWDVCTPENASEFSATAYFFAKQLHHDLKVPVGIIHSSWGGTPAEAWVSKKQIRELGDFQEIMEALKDPYKKQMTTEWFDQWDKQVAPIDAVGWNNVELHDEYIAQPEYVPLNWLTIQLPGRIDVLAGSDVDGAFWFRKTIELDDISGDYYFEMGIVDDTDVVYLNGEKIGGTAYDFSNGRKYPIPSNLLRKGKNTIAIRVIDTGGPGSISKGIKLTSNENAAVSLDGNWEYMFTAEYFKEELYGYDLTKLNLDVRPEIVYVSPYATPSSLYNAMIHPLIPFKMKGVIWYQGESNVGKAEQYKRLFGGLIEDWRAQWHSEFPFYFVQIAPYKYNSTEDPNLDESQELRDAQRHTLSMNKTGMVVTLDIGNNKNIHPANKQDVGARLAGLALANDYGMNKTASGPLYRSHVLKKKKIILQFDYVGLGLMTNDVELIGFEIAGADKKYVPAAAKIVKNNVVVSSAAVSEPKFVRYAWRDTSVASLFNIEGLPASSFTTDQ